MEDGTGAIIVAGATNSGKSSLVNALLRDLEPPVWMTSGERGQATISAMPSTTLGVTSFPILSPDKEQVCYLYDTPGYEPTDHLARCLADVLSSHYFLPRKLTPMM